MASVVLHSPGNKRKNRINSTRHFDFGNSAISGAKNRILTGAFRDNIRNFLQSFGEIEDYTVCDMTVWCTALVSENDDVLPLYVMEETVENSLDPFCEHCELSGWGHHFVCKRRYHFIIPVKQNWNLPLNEYFQEIHSHKLYGLIHCNGYGHLLSINGLRSNSKCSTADDCMMLWDSLCLVLNVRLLFLFIIAILIWLMHEVNITEFVVSFLTFYRSISAHNTTRKEAIDRNFIHSAAYGKSWFETWGYKFGDGWQEYAEHRYIPTVWFLGSLSLDKIIIDSKKKKNIQKIREVIDTYRKLSDTPLATISDLLKFILASQSRNIYNVCKSRTGDQSPVTGFKTFVNSMTTDCRWSAKRLEHVLFVIINLLKGHKANSAHIESCGMSRQELRDEARKTIGDTGLIDFVLKSIKSFTVDNLIIRRSLNPFSRLTAFSIHEISDHWLIDPGLGPDVARDMQFIYENVLEGYLENQVLLSCDAVFVKEWPVRGGVGNHSMMLTCKVLPAFDEMETELTRPLSPGEVVVVEPWIKIGDLRMVAECALRDTYCMMDRFEVGQIGGLRKIEDEHVLSKTVEPGSQVWVRGHGLDLQTQLRYEDGGPNMRARRA